MSAKDRDFEPRFFLKHFNGFTHAQFETENAAYACQQGLKADPDPRTMSFFHFEDENGKKIMFGDNPRSPGHAYKILDIIAGQDCS